MKAQIRALTPTDYGDVQALLGVLTSGIETGDTQAFATLLTHQGTHIIGAEIQGKIAAMATLHILPNMTHSARPYAVVENVVTLPEHQNLGLMRLVMEHIHNLAWSANAYKIMLQTGRDTGAKGFYEKLGYRADQKHGMQIRRVPPRAP